MDFTNSTLQDIVTAISLQNFKDPYALRLWVQQVPDLVVVLSDPRKRKLFEFVGEIEEPIVSTRGFLQEDKHTVYFNQYVCLFEEGAYQYEWEKDKAEKAYRYLTAYWQELTKSWSFKMSWPSLPITGRYEDRTPIMGRAFQHSSVYKTFQLFDPKSENG